VFKTLHTARRGKLFQLVEEVQRHQRLVSEPVAASALALESSPIPQPRVFGKFYDDFSPIQMELPGAVQEHVQPIHREQSIEEEFTMHDEMQRQSEPRQQPVQSYPEPQSQSQPQPHPEPERVLEAQAKTQQSMEDTDDLSSWRTAYKAQPDPDAQAFSTIQKHFHGAPSIDLGEFSLEQASDDLN